MLVVASQTCVTYLAWETRLRKRMCKPVRLVSVEMHDALLALSVSDVRRSGIVAVTRITRAATGHNNSKAGFL